jgi:hypothetical protein
MWGEGSVGHLELALDFGDVRARLLPLLLQPGHTSSIDRTTIGPAGCCCQRRCRCRRYRPHVRHCDMETLAVPAHRGSFAKVLEDRLGRQPDSLGGNRPPPRLFSRIGYQSQIPVSRNLFLKNSSEKNTCTPTAVQCTWHTTHTPPAAVLRFSHHQGSRVLSEGCPRVVAAPPLPTQQAALCRVGVRGADVRGASLCDTTP